MHQPRITYERPVTARQRDIEKQMRQREEESKRERERETEAKNMQESL